MTVTIASDAIRHKGIKYLWGGYLPSTGWDCSGFVSYVLGHDLGMTLPGGFTWSGKAHGPIAAQYKAWAKTTKVSSPVAGDLCCWLTHVGIAVTPTQMISALDPQYGTAITPIKGYGPSGEPLSYRRVTGAATGGVASSIASSCPATALMLPVLIPLALARAGSVHLRSRRDHHRRAEIIGDDQDVILGQLVDDLGEDMPIPPGGLSDVFQHLPVPRPPHHDDRGLPR